MEKMSERGMTQADLCRITGLASSMVSHYCTGQRIPSVPVALKIARVLNTTVDYLAYGDPLKVKEPVAGDLSVSEKWKRYAGTLSPLKYIGDAHALLFKIRSLNMEGQVKVLAYIEDLLSTGKYDCDPEDVGG
jgi:transcriptional regulator with XRE-family HTH domain